MSKKLTKTENLRLGYIENMVKVHGHPLIVTKRIYELMVEKVGVEWCKQNMIIDQPVPSK